MKVNRLEKLETWIPHIKKTGFDALYLGPVFDSDNHGYDTRDYRMIDCRLGDNALFKSLCGKLRENGIRIILDGVFNHVGRGFWAFLDVKEKRQSSPYKDWFFIDWNRNSNYNDGFWYEGWEGHFELVKLNLRNPAVADHILECVGGWIDDFSIDGLRLDVAYSLDQDFVRRLHSYTKGRSPEFFLLGECLHGDYNQFVAPGLFDSCTNYECYKGLYSSFNDMNMFEIAHSLARQFGDRGAMYKDKHLNIFVDNHDVTRIATILKEPKHLPLVYTLMYTMPGIPCVYYGSEWGIEGGKREGDEALRPSPTSPVENDLTKHIAALNGMYKSCPPLVYGDYRQIALTNRQFVFRREYEGKAVIITINADGQPCTAPIGESGPATDMVTGEKIELTGPISMPPYSASVLGIGDWVSDVKESAPVIIPETKVVKVEATVLEVSTTETLDSHPAGFDSLLAIARGLAQDRKLARNAWAGAVAAAILSEKGNIYTGICIDAPSGMGFCAEHAAVAAMITAGESRVIKCVSVKEGGEVLPPCGRCREFINAVHDDNHGCEVLLHDGKLTTIGELLPHRG